MVTLYLLMQGITGISVIIPNYNGESLLTETLPTVLAALRSISLASEIIVVDDCSTDASVSFLKEKFSEIKVIQNKNNSGFSFTCNVGIRAALHDWILILNSDVKLSPGYFNPLLKYTKLQNVFGVMGKIIGWEDDKIQDGAKYPFFHGVKIKTSGNYLLKNETEMSDGIYSLYLSGANAFINKQRLIEIGAFNELFSPFYVEDFELCLRAWRFGYYCYYEHNAVCRHKTSSTIVSNIKRKNIKKIYNRNKMYLHALHLGRPERMLWFFQLFAESILNFITLRWSFNRALLLFLSTYKRVIASRNEMERHSDKKLLSVKDVVTKILEPLKGKKIIRF